MKVGDSVVIKLGVGTKTAEIVKINDRTIWVKLPDGNVIQRHIEKHLVK